MDKFEMFLRDEVTHAETEKDRCPDGHMRMAFVGQAAAFKAVLLCYVKFKSEPMPEETATDCDACQNNWAMGKKAFCPKHPVPSTVYLSAKKRCCWTNIRIRGSRLPSARSRKDCEGEVSNKPSNYVCWKCGRRVRIRWDGRMPIHKIPRAYRNQKQPFEACPMSQTHPRQERTPIRTASQERK